MHVWTEFPMKLLKFSKFTYTYVCHKSLCREQHQISKLQTLVNSKTYWLMNWQHPQCYTVNNTVTKWKISQSFALEFMELIEHQPHQLNTIAVDADADVASACAQRTLPSYRYCLNYFTGKSTKLRRNQCMLVLVRVSNISEGRPIGKSLLLTPIFRLILAPSPLPLPLQSLPFK